MGELNATQLMADTFLRLVVIQAIPAILLAGFLTIGALVVLLVARLTERVR